MANNSQFIIRKAYEADAAQIIEHLKATRNESVFLGSDSKDPLPSLEAEKQMLRDVEQDENKLWLVATATSDDKIIATLNLVRNTRTKVRHRAAFGLAVRKDYLGRHIGSRLMENMLEAAQAMDGLQKIELGVCKDNERGLALYKKFGFKEEGNIEKAYFSDGAYHDEVLMGMFLR